MASCSNVKEIPVFARTNLGTRIVIAVSPETTVGDFKREFERAHLNCFQELGRIRVYALKVKKKSCFYFLPESFPLKYVSENLKNHLLHIEVYHLKNQSGSAESQGAESCNQIFDPKDVPNTNEVQKFVAAGTNNQISYRRKIRKRKRNTVAENPDHRFQQGPNFAEGNCGKETYDSPQKKCPSETISVSSIIKRYFTNYDEVTSSSRETASNYRNREFDMSLPLMTGSTPRQILQPPPVDQHWTKSSRGTNEKNVGRRLIAASDNIGVQLSKKSPTLSFCKFISRNPLAPDSSTLRKDLVFDIPDNSD